MRNIIHKCLRLSAIALFCSALSSADNDKDKDKKPKAKDAVAVPEPSALLLLAVDLSAVAALAYFWRRRTGKPEQANS